MAKPTPIDKPNRRTVEMLFCDLLRREDNDPLYAAYDKARCEVDSLKEKLLDNKRLKILKRRLEAAHSKWWDYRHSIGREVTRVKRLYLAKGLTPEVRKEIDKLLRLSGKA